MKIKCKYITAKNENKIIGSYLIIFILYNRTKSMKIKTYHFVKLLNGNSLRRSLILLTKDNLKMLKEMIKNV